MLIHEFPDIGWLKKQIKENFNNQKAVGGVRLQQPGWPTVVLNSQIKEIGRHDIKGPFSLFLNAKGHSHVKVIGKSQLINDQNFTFSNLGEHYWLDIDSEEHTETFNIHFGEHFYLNAVRSLSATESDLLDNPFDLTAPTPLHTHSVLRSPEFNQLIDRVRVSYSNKHEKMAQEESLFDLLQYVLLTNSKAMRRLANLPLKSVSVKTEIQERLLSARDFIHSYYASPLSLEAISQEAALSRFHFLRLFKAAFGLSPYQYQKQIRLQKAFALVSTTGLSLEHIAEQVGVENASSLSRMFRQSFGQAPSFLRKSVQ